MVSSCRGAAVVDAGILSGRFKKGIFHLMGYLQEEELKKKKKKKEEEKKKGQILVLVLCQ